MLIQDFKKGVQHFNLDHRKSDYKHRFCKLVFFYYLLDLLEQPLTYLLFSPLGEGVSGQWKKVPRKGENLTGRGSQKNYE